MNKESYRVLKEINSLYLNITSSESDIQKEQARLDKISAMQEDARNIIESNKKNLMEIKEKMQVVENDIAREHQLKTKSEGNLSQVFSELEINSLKSQIETAAQKLDLLEIAGLEYLEAIESLEEENSHKESFLKGSSDTYKELELEIKEITTPIKKKIESYKSRIELLKVDLPNELMTKYEALKSRNMPKGPLTQIEGSNCFICGYQISAPELADIEEKLKLKGCSGCSRIIIPKTSLY